MEDEKDAFYVVRKGDIVGIYKSLTDFQAELAPSVVSTHSSSFNYSFYFRSCILLVFEINAL